MKKDLVKLVVVAFTALIFGGVATAQDTKSEKMGKSSSDSSKMVRFIAEICGRSK